MGWRWRKVFGRGPFRATISRRGVGYSLGMPGIRIGRSAAGRPYIVLGFPGTGLYWIKHLDTAPKTRPGSTSSSSGLPTRSHPLAAAPTTVSTGGASATKTQGSPMNQIPFGTNDFAENPSDRCPCVLLLDISGSMGGRPIDELNAGVAAYRQEVLADEVASLRVEVAVVTFGGSPSVITDFTTVHGFNPPVLVAGGETPMGSAINQGLDLIDRRKQEYKTNKINYFRPWVFLITDGEPTDEWAPAAQRVRAGEAAKAFAFFAVGVQNANMEKLKQIAVREPLRLDGLKFQDLFRWLSASQARVSRSKPTDEIALDDPTKGPNGWAMV